MKNWKELHSINFSYFINQIILQCKLFPICIKDGKNKEFHPCPDMARYNSKLHKAVTVVRSKFYWLSMKYKHM